MKHQYFGDINDFHKYTLLQHLCGNAEFGLGVCWLLTPNDRGNDGRRIGYLHAPEKWRAHNPNLFDLLVGANRLGDRNVNLVESWDLWPHAQFCSGILTDSGHGRRTYFREMLEKFAKAKLIFFDPDDGLEVNSVPFGTRNSSKYLYWSEVREAFGAGHSILIYQHFRREKRNRFTARIAARLLRTTSATEVHSFRTSHVVFFLIPRAEHAAHFHRAMARVEETGGDHFEIRSHRSEERRLLTG